MTQALVTQLQNILSRIKSSTDTRERNILLADASLLLTRLYDAQKVKKDTIESTQLFQRLLASVGRASKFPGVRRYIRRQREFDNVIDEIERRYGAVEEIIL